MDDIRTGQYETPGLKFLRSQSGPISQSFVNQSNKYEYFVVLLKDEGIISQDRGHMYGHCGTLLHPLFY
ncbi:MAG: hypothetical protein KJN96_02605, partial [Eudoraea sp.]|nr:hypothetical protein [Eudoraea sp.]